MKNKILHMISKMQNKKFSQHITSSKLLLKSKI